MSLPLVHFLIDSYAGHTSSVPFGGWFLIDQMRLVPCTEDRLDSLLNRKFVVKERVEEVNLAPMRLREIADHVSGEARQLRTMNEKHALT